MLIAQDDSSHRDWFIGIYSSVIKISFWNTDGTRKDLESSFLPTVSEWTHLCGTISEGYIKLYVNGILNETETYTGDLRTISTITTIGNFDGSDFFNGSIDEVRIYNRALSADEIRNLYEQRDEIHDPFVYKTV